MLPTLLLLVEVEVDVAADDVLVLISTIPVELAAATLVVSTTALVTATLVETAAAVVVRGLPLVPMGVTAAKSVFFPNAALNASACAPVPFAAASAAWLAVVQVEMAAAFARHLLFSWPQMKLLITSMLSADPWLNEPN